MSYQSASTLPAYYDLLHIPVTATSDDIRTAYKKESLRTHPDRNPKATTAERKKQTEKFQAVADAYYVLSDTQRRREYDALLRTRGARAGFTPSSGSTGSASTDPAASAAFFEQFRQYFTNASAGAAPGTGTSHRFNKNENSDEEEETPLPESGTWNAGARPDAEATFTNVFDDLLRPEIERTVNWWTYLGAVSGASLGFILANIPGALAGGLAGNRLGAIRDAKGKPVVQVFTALGGTEKAAILKALAIKVFGSLTAM